MLHIVAGIAAKCCMASLSKPGRPKIGYLHNRTSFAKSGCGTTQALWPYAQARHCGPADRHPCLVRERTPRCNTRRCGARKAYQQSALTQDPCQANACKKRNA